jgi:hypothetical protein
VVDVGGTTSDIGSLQRGFPREAPKKLLTAPSKKRSARGSPQSRD